MTMFRVLGIYNFDYTFETSETRSLWLDLKQYHSNATGELVRPKMVTINSLLCIKKAYGRWHTLDSGINVAP